MKSTSFLNRPFRYTFNNGAMIIIAVNIGVFLLANFMPEIMTYCALNLSHIMFNHAYWQFFTYMFLHDGTTHLLFNMIALLCFGVALERAIGTKEFILFYFLAGIFCGIVSFVIFLCSAKMGYLLAFYIRLVGASGAIYALLLAYAVFFPDSQILVFFILPVPAPILVIAYAALEFFSNFFGSNSSIAHFAHLAGFVFAWLYLVIRMRINPWKVWFRK